MKQYEYVPREEYEPVKRQLEKIVRKVQQELSEEFGFDYVFVGSASRDMITREVKGNQGYDFDIDLKVDSDINLSPKELKHILMRAFDKFSGQFCYGHCRNKTRVLTIKVTDRKNSRIIHSCDIAIVRDYIDLEDRIRQENVIYDKTNERYLWNERSLEYFGLKEKVDYIEKTGHRNELLKVYIEKKCRYSDKKESRALYAEAVNEIYDRFCSETDETIELINNGFSGAILITNKVKKNNWPWK